MVTRVGVAPHMLQWARKRSGRPVEDFHRKFPKLAAWESGDSLPTMRQLEAYATFAYTPVGFLFLPEPPHEELPLPDYRTFGGQQVPAPSPDLLDTISACEQRQEWYRGYAREHGLSPVALVGLLTVDDPPVEAAALLRQVLGFDLARRVEFSNWTEALSGLIEHAETAGVLVMVNGVVGSNTHRKLNPQEFRGFSLTDELAPVVFINGADTKAAQIFSLTHELAHVALGGSALSRPDLADLFELDNDHLVERWCNQVAAELLVPAGSLAVEFSDGGDLTAELNRLAKFYKVSTLVVLRRVFDAQLMSWAQYRDAYDAELARVLELLANKTSGGDYYNTQPVRISKTFARALISDTSEGRTSYRDAFRLIGSQKMSTFEGLSDHLGVA